MVDQMEKSELQSISEEAAEWLIRLDGDSAITRADKKALGEWMTRSPVHRDKLTQLAGTWDQLNVLTELAVPLGSAPPSGEAKPFWRFPQMAMGAAGMAMTFLLGIFFLFQGGVFSPALDATNGGYRTAIGEQKTLDLADGSTLILNTNSQIQVRYGEQYRDIALLQGEVHFDVAKNKNKPFRVFAGKGRVEAVGTAFTVYRAERSTDVTVTEGRVAVASVSVPRPNQDDPAADVIGSLIAGQGASIRPNIKAGKALPDLVLEDVAIYSEDDLQRRLAWREGLLIFSGESLEQVVAEISRYTDAEIDIPEAEVRALSVGGQFAVGDTDLMLDVLEATFDLAIDRSSDKRVTILSRK